MQMLKNKSRTFPRGIRPAQKGLFNIHSSPQQAAGYSGKVRDKNKTILKPWGGYIVLEKKKGYWIKKLFVRRGARLSLQSHKHRSEIWIVLSGLVEAIKGSSRLKLKKGDFLKINKNEKHRMTGLKNSWICEVALGKARERDIKRYQDDYGRIK